jgi:hypothetical protein
MVSVGIKRAKERGKIKKICELPAAFCSHQQNIKIK